MTDLADDGLPHASLAAAAVCAIAMLIGGCTGTVTLPSPPASVPAGSVANSCPTLPSAPIVLQGCSLGVGGIPIESGQLLTHPTLTCGGDGKMYIKTSDPTGHGATRYDVTLQDFSKVSGEVAQTDPTCTHHWNLSPFVLEFGLTYTGDQGVEPGTTTPCIFESKVVYSQFQIEQDAFSAFDAKVRDGVHAALDSAVIGSLYPSVGKPGGRCARWKPLP